MKISSRKICLCLLLIAVLAIVPLLVTAFFAHAQYDDYYYGIKTYHAVKSGENVFRAAAEQVKETYQNWQGTYSAVFLFALHPAVFGEKFYALTTFVMLGAIIGSTFLLTHTLFGKYFPMSRPARVIVATAISLVSIELVPSPVQSYYWWNGSVYYTLFHSLALTLISVILLYLKSEKIHARVIYIILQILLAAIIGGGNFVTALCTAVILFLIILCLAFKKDKRAFAVAAAFIVFLIGFGISIASPGNAIRAQAYTDCSVAPIPSILLSFVFSASRILTWSSIPLVLTILLLFPVLARAASKSSLKFRHPGLFFLLSYAVYSTQFTPTIYAMGSVGDQRISDIIFYSTVWLFVANAVYIGGFLCKNRGFDAQKAIDFITAKKNFRAVAAVMAVVWIFTAAGPAENFGEKFDASGTATSSAIYSLATGEAKTYDRENNERIEILTDNSVKDVVFKPFSKNPRLLFYGDLLDDKDFMWANKPMAEYFDKDSIIVDWG